MTSFPALDVAIGLSFAYFLFSVLSTTITETISRFTKMRARKMRGLAEGRPRRATTDGMRSYDEFMETPIMTRAAQVGRAAGQAPEAVETAGVHPVDALRRGRAQRGRLRGSRPVTAAAAAWKAAGDDIARLARHDRRRRAAGALRPLGRRHRPLPRGLRGVVRRPDGAALRHLPPLVADASSGSSAPRSSSR